MHREGLYAFWRASKLFGHPFGRLAEWEIDLLAIRSEGVSGEGWVHYLHGAMAVRGLEPALWHNYEDGMFFLKDGDTKKRTVIWAPDTGTLSVGVFWANMERYCYAVFKGKETSVLTKTPYPALVKDTLGLVDEVLGDEYKRRVAEALGKGG